MLVVIEVSLFSLFVGPCPFVRMESLRFLVKVCFRVLQDSPKVSFRVL